MTETQTAPLRISIPAEVRKLSRLLSIVENESEGYEEILHSLSQDSKVPLIGITGAPGAGKSTLINALITYEVSKNKKVGVVSVDPTSPFTHGSLLGDRIRMTEHYTNPNVFIRSVATRGSLGGLCAKAIEITDVMKAADFDIIFIETVGIGQQEVDIASLADVTLLVLVPEGGDDIQNLKSGVMEVADIYVLNKADRPGADLFLSSLKHTLKSGAEKSQNKAVLATMASLKSGIKELAEAYENAYNSARQNEKRKELLVSKIHQLLIHKAMQNFPEEIIRKSVEEFGKADFNPYLLATRLWQQLH